MVKAKVEFAKSSNQDKVVADIQSYVNSGAALASELAVNADSIIVKGRHLLCFWCKSMSIHTNVKLTLVSRVNYSSGLLQ